MAGNGALDLSIRIVGKVDPSLGKAIKQAQGLTGSLAKAIGGTQSLGSAMAETIGVVGKTGLGIMTALTTAAGVMIKQTTALAEEHEANIAAPTKYIQGVLNEDGSINKEKQSEMSDQILKMSTQIPIKPAEMSEIAAALGQSGKTYEQIFFDKTEKDATTGESVTTKSYLYDTARLSAAWDIDAKSAADYMAKWETAFGKTHKEIIGVADTINYLGANMATTAAEIASVVNVSGGVGQTAGVELNTTSALASTLLAMGVADSKAGTTLNRVYTNVSLGSGATKAQTAVWKQLGFTPEGVAKSMQTTGPNGEDGAASTLYSVFEAISKQDKDQQTYMIKTLFGQWAIEGVSKIVGNLPAFHDALIMANDTESSTGSMEKELLVKLSTGEAVDQMASNATDRLLISIGNAFLPAKKELAGMWIDIANGITDNLPDLTNLVNSILPLLKIGIQGIGTAAQAALPWIQKGIDFTTENGPMVAKTIGGLAATFATMSVAPSAYNVGSSIIHTAGNFAIGGRPSGAPGGSVGGVTLRSVANALTPTNLFSSAVSGGKNLLTAGKAAAFGAGLANSSMTQVNGSSGGFLERAQNGIIGAVIGLKNQKALTSENRKPGAFWKTVLGTANQITDAKKSGGILGMLKGSEIGGYASNVGQSLTNLKGAAFSFGTNTPVGRVITGTGNVAGQILSGIVGPNGLDIGKMVGGIKSFAGAGKTVIGDGLQNAWKTVGQSKVGSAVIGAGSKAAGFAGKVAGGALSTAKGALNLGGAGLGVLGSTIGPVAGKLGSGFMTLLGTFGPIITGLGTIVAVVSLLGDHFTDIQQVVLAVFGPDGLTIFNTFAGKILNIGSLVKDTLQNTFSTESLQGIQEKLSGVNAFGINLGEAFGVAMPVIQSVVGVIQQIVDLGVNHIKPVISEIIGFVVNEGLPAIMPLLSVIISLVGTTLVNAIKVVVDVVGKILPIVEPMVLGIIGLVKSIATIGVKVVNFIIRALNKFQITVPDWVPEIGGKQFGFNLQEVALPQFANGGMTHGPSIAGEAGPEAVISFKRNVREQNIETWVKAGKLLGVDFSDLLGAAGEKPRLFANGGFTDNPSHNAELIDFAKAQRQNRINQIKQNVAVMGESVAAAMLLGSDMGVAFSRTTDITNYAVDALEKVASMEAPAVTENQSKLTQTIYGGIGKAINGAQTILGNEKAQQVIGTIRDMDAVKAELEYTANTDRLDLSNVSFFPTAGDPELSWQNLQTLQAASQEVELPDIGKSASDSEGSTTKPGGASGRLSYQRTYTSTSGNTYVYSPNITVYGGMTADELRTVLEEDYERFCENTERYERERRQKDYA